MLKSQEVYILEFRSDTISGWLEIYSCNINSFKGVNIIPREGHETLRINQCRLNDFTYSTTQKERLDIRFWRDTINGSFSIIDTSSIDTSKNVTFDKLSFRSTRWLVWFFVQYLVGLFCLFFIVNAIIKF